MMKDADRTDEKKPNDGGGRLPGRRGFVGTLVGGLIGLPMALRGQTPTPEVPVIPPGHAADSTRPTRPETDDPERERLERLIEERKRELREMEGENDRQDRPLIYPPALREGSTIGVVAPASGSTSGDISSGAAALRRLGYRVKLADNLGRGFGYLASSSDRGVQVTPLPTSSAEESTVTGVNESFKNNTSFTEFSIPS